MPIREFSTRNARSVAQSLAFKLGDNQVVFVQDPPNGTVYEYRTSVEEIPESKRTDIQVQRGITKSARVYQKGTYKCPPCSDAFFKERDRRGRPPTSASAARPPSAASTRSDAPAEEARRDYRQGLDERAESAARRYRRYPIDDDDDDDESGESEEEATDSDYDSAEESEVERFRRWLRAKRRAEAEAEYFADFGNSNDDTTLPGAKRRRE